MQKTTVYKKDNKLYFDKKDNKLYFDKKEGSEEVEAYMADGRLFETKREAEKSRCKTRFRAFYQEGI